MAVKPSLRKEDWKGRQKVGCGYPPSIARSQKVRGGILGITIQKREQSFGTAQTVDKTLLVSTPEAFFLFWVQKVCT